jgi:hypothetical protein
VNYSGDIVVQSSRLPTRPFLGPKGQYPFWTTSIFIWDLFGSGAGVDIMVTPKLPETFDPDTIPFTTDFYFPGTDASPNNHILTIPLQMVHYTMVPDTMSPHIGITMASQAPIGTFTQIHPNTSARISCVECFYSRFYTNIIRDSWCFHSF